MYLIITTTKIQLSKLPGLQSVAKPLLSAVMHSGLGWPQTSSGPMSAGGEGASVPLPSSFLLGWRNLQAGTASGWLCTAPARK